MNIRDWPMAHQTELLVKLIDILNDDETEFSLDTVSDMKDALAYTEAQVKQERMKEGGQL